MTNLYVTDIELKDAMHLAKARVFHYQQIGWTMFSKNELESAAYEGISEALIRFNPSKGTVKDTKFTSYAYFWIEKYLKEYITNNKTMLNGSNADLWNGNIPYTQSIDAYDDANNDTEGSDHKDWLGTGIMASANIENTEHTKQINDLLAKVFIDLEPMQRLVMQLSIGIGTVHGMQLSVRDIARQLHQTSHTIEQIMSDAIVKLQELKPKYSEQFNELY